MDNGQSSLREVIIEMFNRFALSLDDGLPDLLSSCLTTDMTMDLTAFTAIGMNIPTLQGRQTVIEALMKSVGKTQDSTHQLTNFLVDEKLNGQLDVQCYALVQHFRLGEGASNEKHDYYLMGNRYRAVVVKEEGEWRMKSLVVRPAWVQGNIDVVKAH